MRARYRGVRDDQKAGGLGFRVWGEGNTHVIRRICS